jgi:CRISPR/Cas system type I-B associated protein Csh2 (Cas7 group RAMP superfamily)
MKTLLFTFDSEESRSKFVDILKSKFDATQAISVEDTDLVARTLKTAVNDPSVVSSEHRHCSVWVSGKKIVEGDFKKMNERFMQECGVHSASVVLKQLKNNEWCDIRKRRLQ